MMHIKEASGHFENCIILFFDPQNMGIDTSFDQLSLLMTEIWQIIDFCIMAA